MFSEFKKYIINHPRVAEYRPTSDNYNKDKLLAILKTLDPSSPQVSKFLDDPTTRQPDDLPNNGIGTKSSEMETSVRRIADFIQFSTYLHKWWTEFYRILKQDMIKTGLSGAELSLFPIAMLNRDWKVITEKRREQLKKVPEGLYMVSDLMNFKIDPENGMKPVDIRAAMENETDSVGLIMNYLRYFNSDDFEPSAVSNQPPVSDLNAAAQKQPALAITTSPSEMMSQKMGGVVLRMKTVASVYAVLKRCYDDVLYGDGYVEIDEENHRVFFGDDSCDKLLSLAEGEEMFSQRRLRVFDRLRQGAETGRRQGWMPQYRLKKVEIEDGVMTPKLVRANPKEFTMLELDMRAAMKSYYEFLDKNAVLTMFNGATAEEVIRCVVALQYLVNEVVETERYDDSLFTKDDFRKVPCRMNQRVLMDYLKRFTSIDGRKLKCIIDAMTAQMNGFSDIWTRPLFEMGNDYLMPFFPMLYSSPYNLIDCLLKEGGFDLDERGRLFEEYLLKSLTEKETSYPLTCIGACLRGSGKDSEEIDLIIGMKNIVVVADAKCIHYPMTPQNFHDAEERLRDGARQAVRKARFVEEHPELFKELGDYTGKRILPVVITNYPFFTGIVFDGTPVVDSHSLLAYMTSGVISLRELGMEGDRLRGAHFLYNNEDEFCTNLEDFLRNNPMKEWIGNQMEVVEKSLLPDLPDEWQFVAVAAQLKGNPLFNINATNAKR